MRAYSLTEADAPPMVRVAFDGGAIQVIASFTPCNNTPRSSHPTTYTPHPTTYTPHPTTYTLHPMHPWTLHPNAPSAPLHISRSTYLGYRI